MNTSSAACRSSDVQDSLFHRFAQFLKHHSSRDARQCTAVQGRGVGHAVRHRKNVCGSAFRDLSALVEQDRIIESVPVGVLEQREVLYPMKESLVPANGDAACRPCPLRPRATVSGASVKSAVNATTSVARPEPGPSHRPPWLRIMISRIFDSGQRLRLTSSSSRSRKSSRSAGMATLSNSASRRQPFPVPLKRERDPPIDPECGEDPPSGEQAHLSRSKHGLASGHEPIVV